ncbi:hypothetical protein [Nostoc sp.]|uniref:hypothetical protein n=1 Tax=Nostoc sp. TaxID=1180 RepID=UPI002FF556C3
MSTDKLIKFYILEKRNLNLVPLSKAKLIIVKPAVKKPDLLRLEKAITPDEALFFIP